MRAKSTPRKHKYVFALVEWRDPQSLGDEWKDPPTEEKAVCARALTTGFITERKGRIVLIPSLLLNAQTGKIEKTSSETIIPTGCVVSVKKYPVEICLNVNS